MTTEPTSRPEKKTRGGKREGAGRPSIEPLYSVKFRLSQADLDIATQIGDGDRTKGVRVALRGYKIKSDVK